LIYYLTSRQAESAFLRMIHLAPEQSQSSKVSKQIYRIDFIKNKNLEKIFEETKEQFCLNGIPTEEQLMFHGTHSDNIDSILAEGFKMDAVPKDRPKGEFLCLSHCRSVILSLCVSVSFNLCLSISLSLSPLTFLSQSPMFHGTHFDNIHSILAEGFKMDAVPRGHFVFLSLSLCNFISLCLCLLVSLTIYLSLISYLSLSFSLNFYETHSYNIDCILAKGFKMNAVRRDQPKSEFSGSSYCPSVILSLCVSVSLYLCLLISLSLSSLTFLSHSPIFHRTHYNNIDSILAEDFKIDAVPRDRSKGEFSLFICLCFSVSLNLCLSVCLSVYLSLMLCETHSNNIDSILPKMSCCVLLIVILSLCVSVSLYLFLFISLYLSSLTFLSHSLIFHGTHSNNIDSVLAEGFKMDAVPNDCPKGELLLSICFYTYLYICLSLSSSIHPFLLPLLSLLYLSLLSVFLSISLSHDSRNSHQQH
jgi:hypothetical protein